MAQGCISEKQLVDVFNTPSSGTASRELRLVEEKYYECLPGGILESFGRLFNHDLQLYVSAELDTNTSIDIHAMQVADMIKDKGLFNLKEGD